ncbi:hypothetical protein Tco_1436607, partial [Tanacetum coccineum]
MVEGSFPSLSDAFDSPSPTSLADNIRDNESKMLQGKLIFFGDDGKPLKSKSVYANDSFVKANDGAKLTGNRDVSYANLLNGVL